VVLVIGLGKSKTLLVPSDRATRFPNTFSDEILYNAKIHPEQYSNTLSAAQVKQLHKSIQYICNFAVDHLSDSSTFPEEWLFKHRWGKGKKDSLTKRCQICLFESGRKDELCSAECAEEDWTCR